MPDFSGVLSYVGRRQRLASALLRPFLRLSPLLYHFWYYHNYVQGTTQWMGVSTQKSVSDMWNYQEIIFNLKPSLIVEFGTCRGGSALFFAGLMRQMGHPFRVFSVDVSSSLITPVAAADKNIELMTASSTDVSVTSRIKSLRKEFPGPIFAILDSDHSKAHVLNEMLSLRDVLQAGDYLIVEDANVNGHPVLLGHGPGPYEAMTEYFKRFPDDYRRDPEREKKFGFTFATKGYLMRR
jgi:cephalosporin hydroxylase